MRKLLLRNRARHDLTDIFEYTRRRWSFEQAEPYLSAINGEFQRLRDTPELGRPVSGTQAPFLRRSVGSHIIFFLADDQTLDIVRVLHASMDFLTHLANDDT